jgi:hypothetical protein
MLRERLGGLRQVPSVRHFEFLIPVTQEKRMKVKNTRFVVMVSRGGARAPQYVERLDRTPIQTTSNRKHALTMGRLTAEDAVKSMQNSRCIPELVPVQI